MPATVASTLWSTVLGVIEELFAQSNSNCSGIVASKYSPNKTIHN